MTESADPFALAARQDALDHIATRRSPALRERKREKLRASPHAFLRGSAPLFYEILAARPELAGGPDGRGWIAGDMHLENVGAYRTDLDRVVFGLNDFDDAAVGPQHLDVLRLSTSALLAGLSLRCTGAEALDLVDHLIGAYLRGLAGASRPPPPDTVAELVERTEGRSKKKLLDDWAPLQHGRRRFTRSADHRDIPADLCANAGDLLAAYVAALEERAPDGATAWTVEDAVQRMTGNGSLGAVRIALLVRDRDGEERLFELKESCASATGNLQPSSEGAWSHHAERAVAGARALTGEPPRQLAAFSCGGLSFTGRRLSPQEDKLDFKKMHAGPKLDGVVEHIGHLVGVAHARGRSAPAPTWTQDQIGLVVDHAVVLSGLFEGVYLAYVRRYR